MANTSTRSFGIVTSLTGLTAGSFTGEQTLISGATASTNAMTVAIEDVFAAFQAISATDGGNN